MQSRARQERNRIPSEHLVHFARYVRPSDVPASDESAPPAPVFRPLQRNLRCYIPDIGLPYEKLPIFRPNLTVEWKKVDLVDIMVDEDNPVTCPICLDESLLAPRIARCGHAFCWICILKYINFQNTNKGKPCPLCMHSLYKGDLKPVRFQIKKKPTVLTFALLTQKEGAHTAVLHPDICEMLCGTRQMHTGNSIAYSSSLDVQFWDVAYTDNHRMREILNNDYLTLESIALNAREEDEVTYKAVVEAINELTANGITAPSDTPSPSANLVENIQESINRLKEVSDSYVHGISPRSASGSDAEGGTKTYCFYQSIDGAKVILHPVLLKCLWHCVGQAIENMPLFLVDLPVTELEEIVVTARLRRRYNWLNHFRMGSKIHLAHVPLESYVSQSKLDEFMTQRQIALDMKYSKILQSREEA